MMCCTKAAAIRDATKCILPYYNRQRAIGIDPIPNIQNVKPNLTTEPGWRRQYNEWLHAEGAEFNIPYA